LLKDKGLTNVAALLGGLQAWKDAGFPIEKGGAKTSKR
jgi:rhodanese-related sulfurtransferase